MCVHGCKCSSSEDKENSNRQIPATGSTCCSCHIGRLLLSNCSVFCTLSVSTHVWCSICICKIRYSYLGITAIFTFDLYNWLMEDCKWSVKPIQLWCGGSQTRCMPASKTAASTCRLYIRPPH